jgi:hypothetical protein
MEQATMAKLLAVAVAIVSFAIGASQGDLIELGIAFGAGVTASIGIWLQPKTDFGDWKKLTNHLFLSVPLAGLAFVSGGIDLYNEGFLLWNWLGLVVLLLVPTSILEQRLMGNTP